MISKHQCFEVMAIYSIMYINIFTQFLYNTCDLAYMFINRADIYNSHLFIYKYMIPYSINSVKAIIIIIIIIKQLMLKLLNIWFLNNKQKSNNDPHLTMPGKILNQILSVIYL